MQQQCLNDPILSQLVEGRLPEPALSLALIHLNVCEGCRYRFQQSICSSAKEFSVKPSIRLPLNEVPSQILKIPSLSASADAGLPKQAFGMTCFSHFEILGEISKSLNSTVLEARDPRLNRKVAIKILDQGVAQNDPLLVNQFLNEARIVAQINHPGIVSIYDVGVYEEKPYIVMPLLNGESLRSRLDRGSIEPNEAIRLTLQLLDGLKAAHGFRIIHKDIKPENLWLIPNQSGSKDLLILDFGNAQLANTLSDSAAGTPLYVSPEQVLNGLIDERTDLFSLGTVLYEMLAGKPAWGFQSEDELSNPAGDPSIPAQFTQVLERLLTLEPADRYHDYDVLRSDLLAALKKWEKKQKSRRLRIVSACGMIGILAAVITGNISKSFVQKSVQASKSHEKAGRSASQNDLAKANPKTTKPVIKPNSRFQAMPGSMMAASSNGEIVVKNTTDGNYTVYDTAQILNAIGLLSNSEKASRVWINPSGKFVATLQQNTNENVMKVWRVHSGSSTRPVMNCWELKLGINEPNDAAWMDRDGSSYLYLAVNNNKIKEFKFPIEDGRKPVEASIVYSYAKIIRLYPQPKGDLLVGAKEVGGVDIFNVRERRVKHSFRVFFDEPASIYWNPDQNRFLSTRTSGEMLLYDIRRGIRNDPKVFDHLKILDTYNFPRKVYESVYLNDDQLVVRSSDDDKYLLIFNFKTKVIDYLVDPEGDPVSKIVALPNSRFATIGKTGTIRMYDFPSRSVLKP